MRYVCGFLVGAAIAWVVRSMMDGDGLWEEWQGFGNDDDEDFDDFDDEDEDDDIDDDAEEWVEVKGTKAKSVLNTDNAD
jgi:hypothetical protein